MHGHHGLGESPKCVLRKNLGDSWDQFSDVISQDLVATLLRCIGMFNDKFIANFLVTMPVREF